MFRNIFKAMLFGVITMTLFSACKNNPPPAEQATEQTELFTIKPPIPDLDPRFFTFDFKAEKGGFFSLKNGSKITVPANAFVDENGKAVVGDMKLNYREFHDAASIYLSGIPMEIAVKDKTEHLQTAGMFDIRAEQEGKMLELAEGKSATVRMASWESGADYNFYNLDENSGDWKDLGTRKPSINTKKVRLEKEVKNINPGQKFPLSSKYFTFSYEAFMDVYYSGKIKNADKDLMKKLIGDYGFTYTDVSCREVINFEGGKQPGAFMVWKNLSGMPIPIHENRTWTKLTKLEGKNRYHLAVEDGKEKVIWSGEIEAFMTLKSLMAFPPEHWRDNYEEAMAMIREKRTAIKLMTNVFREHEIMQLGIYNWDKIWENRESVKLLAEFDLGNPEHKLMDREVVFISGDNKVLVKFPETNWANMRLAKDKNARLFSLLPNQKVGVYTAKQYNRIDFKQLQNAEHPTFAFDMQKEVFDIKSEKDLRKALGI